MDDNQIAEAELHGSWRLAEATYRLGDGSLWGGEQFQQTGFISYHANGTMAAQLMTPERPHLSSKDSEETKRDKLIQIFNGYTAYYGTFAIDAAASRVIHSVQGSLLPNWVGRELVRYYQFSEDGLVLNLTTPPMGKQQMVGRLAWQKIV